MTWVLGGVLLVPVVIIVGLLTLVIVPALAAGQAITRRSMARPASTAGPADADGATELRGPVAQQPELAGRTA